ncbi:hypothetical protein Poly30_10160 [Planctomycetes bacterium Poly30]|uniref:Uncharacterized protein n=1 Tax=Saltatorellus ferox TaxID=2528018 RepID=A0A518EN52_9BACT|nr:hypothetical protein Poly30_10160 [Planctomycetes bacterium Poly30]
MKLKSTLCLLGTLSLALLFALPADAAPQRRRGTTRTRTQPAAEKPLALVVLLENGGIEANLEACLGKSNRRAKITVATAGGLSIPIAGQAGLPRALKDAAVALSHLSAPLSPSLWKIERITLEEWISRTSDWLLEELVKGFQAKSGMRSLYAKLIVLEDEKMTPAHAVSVISSLAKTHQVDVHTLVHGRNNEFIGHDGAAFGRANFFDPLKAAGVDLRAVYQMNCVSGTLMDEWLELGADVVNGTLGTKNNYMPHQYFHFQKYWVDGSSFGNAVTQAYADARNYSEPAYSTVGMIQSIEDSRMQVQGATGLTARPTLFQLAAPIVAGAVRTAGQIAEDLKAGGESLARTIAALLEQGYSLAEAAAAAQAAFLREGSELARGLIEAGVSVADTISTCREAATKLTYETIVRGLKLGGASAKDIARGLKGQAQQAKNVAKWLESAGFGPGPIVKALRQGMQCNLATIADALHGAGTSFQHTAQAMWDDIRSHTPQSKIPAAIGDLIQVMATEFQFTVVHVAGELAKLGIK